MIEPTPAFPQDARTGNLEDWRHGMSLCHWYAGLAMQSLIHKLGDNPFASSEDLANRAKLIPGAAFQIARAMVAEGEKE